MRTFLKLSSLVGLGLTVIPSFLIFAQTIMWKTYLTLMTIGTLLWFLTAPFWMKKES